MKSHVLPLYHVRAGQIRSRFLHHECMRKKKHLTENQPTRAKDAKENQGPGRRHAIVIKVINHPLYSNIIHSKLFIICNLKST